LSARWSTVLPEDGDNLSYSPHVILTDSSTETTRLELSVSNVKMCQTKSRFKVHFFCDNKLKFTYIWLAINFIYLICMRVSSFLKIHIFVIVSL